MIQEFKKIWKTYAIGLLWLMGIIWPTVGYSCGRYAFLWQSLYRLVLHCRRVVYLPCC
jgi:hypothetical protein